MSPRSAIAETVDKRDPAPGAARLSEHKTEIAVIAAVVVVGAATGGVGTAVAGSYLTGAAGLSSAGALTAGAVGGLVGGAASSATGQLLTTGSIDAGQLGRDSLIGAGSGGLFGAAGRAVNAIRAGGTGAGRLTGWLQASRQTRQTYNIAAQQIADDGVVAFASSSNTELLARSVVASRNAVKEEARENSPRIFNLFSRTRNRLIYRNPMGPTYEQLSVNKSNLEIITRAGHTNSRINKLFGLE